MIYIYIYIYIYHVVLDDFDERPWSMDALPQMSALPPGVRHVCAGSPHMAACYTCIAEDRCGWSEWEAYRVLWTAPALNTVAPFFATLSGLRGELNRIVVEFLGRFCTSTFDAHVNAWPRGDFCNFCRQWGHGYDFQSCTTRFAGWFNARWAVLKKRKFR